MIQNYMRWDVINHLIKVNNYKSYLEIGYYKGWSFDAVKCENKVAVDPYPCKTERQEQFKGGMIKLSGKVSPIYYKENDNLEGDGFIVKDTSDHFFSLMTPEDKWDIIFIDGLHEATQASRDLDHALFHLSGGGTIVIHDCNPPLYEHTTTGIDGCWTGDVYKAFIRFRKTTPLVCYTVDTDWGVGIIKGSEYMKDEDIHTSMVGNYPVPLPRGEELPKEIEFPFFDKYRRRLINLITPEQFLERENGNMDRAIHKEHI